MKLYTKDGITIQIYSEIEEAKFQAIGYKLVVEVSEAPIEEVKLDDEKVVEAKVVKTVTVKSPKVGK